MTSNIARDALIETYKSLWTSEGDDDQRDFIIESVDDEGEKTATFSVHSTVLTMRSEMFKTMINGESSFVENKERKVKIPFSSKAVEMMVKFMYGIELEDCEDPLRYFEIIMIGGVYGIENLKKAAAEKIRPYVTKDLKLLHSSLKLSYKYEKDTIFEILLFAHVQKADDLKKILADVIISTFSEEEVLMQKAIIYCPEIGMELWQLFENKKKAETRSNSVEDTMISIPAQEMQSKPALQEQDVRSKRKVWDYQKPSTFLGDYTFWLCLLFLLLVFCAGFLVIGCVGYKSGETVWKCFVYLLSLTIFCSFE